MELRLTAGSPHSRAEQRDGGRAGRPGPRRAFLVAFAAGAIGAAIAVPLALDGSPAAKDRAAALKYGGIPSWIPKAKVPVTRIVHASPAHPWLAIEGDTVAVALPGGRGLVTAVGPEVPPGVVGHIPLVTHTLCTFIVTYAQVKGALPLKPRAFTIVDELGQLIQPHVTQLGGGRLAALAVGSRPLSVKVSAVLPVGSGTLRWAPLAGRPVVSWDFDVEVD